MVNDLPSYVNNVELEERLGESSLSILRKKYLLRDGEVYETPAHRFYTVASALAGVEERYGANPDKIQEFTRHFYEMMANLDFLPGGRVLANAGSDIGALANCYVLPVEDDLSDIFQTVKEAAIVHKNGGGTGYNFSRIRPRGWRVKKGIASGPISFAGQFDKETEIINSGNRRGANMGILNIDHPDLFEFIRSKDQYGVLTNFNVSLGVTDEFMEAYKKRGEYPLKFNGTELTREQLEEVQRNCSRMKAGSDVGKEAIPPYLQVEGDEVWNVYPVLEELVTSWGEKLKIVKYLDYDEEGKRRVDTQRELVGRIDEGGIVKISAEKILDLIANYAHRTGEPGLIFLDLLERDNMIRDSGPLDTTNPCGEQPLHPHDACNLGSINLGNMVTSKRGIDYQRLEHVVRTAVRFMDNVNDLNRGPIPKIEETMRNHRRIGLGVMGWADMLYKMRVSYDSEEGYSLAEDVMSFINEAAEKESRALAEEKGVFPKFDKSSYGDQRRVRNLARTTIAPTGSISMVAGVNSGIEPWFALNYYKKMRGGDIMSVTNRDFLEALKDNGIDDNQIERIVQKVKENNGSCQGIEEVPEDIQKIFKTAGDLSYKAHIEMQARFQSHVDNAISKTINFPNDASVEDIKEAYVFAYERGVKGITVYRDGSLETQVLDTGSPSSKNSFDLERMIAERLNAERPDNVVGRTEKVRTPYAHNAFLTFNFEENGNGRKPYECFVSIAKSGGDLPALAEMGGRLISMALKAGIPPEYIAEQLVDIGGETQSGVGERKVKSLPDAFGKAILRVLSKENYATPSLKKNGDSNKDSGTKKHSGNLCEECGLPLRMEEGCQKCSCGFSKC
jgi:ribonucleoside-diphosphate reductase alpha chain